MRRGAADGGVRRTAEVDGVPLAWVEAGPPDAPALVLLHGLGGSHRWWVRNLPVLGRRFRVLAPDLPGFGASGHGPGPYPLTRFAAAILSWLERLELDGVCLVGHSMGAAIAALAAAERPERVGRTVLVAPAVVPRLLYRGEPLALSRRLMVRGVLAAWRESIRPLSFYPLVLADTRRTTQAWINQAAEAILTAPTMDRLRGVPQPALVVAGGRDRMIPVVVARAVARRLPRGRLTLLPNAGHNLMYERPVLFNRLVADFAAPRDDEPTRLVS